MGYNVGMPFLEAVPNVSEGKNPAVLRALEDLLRAAPRVRFLGADALAAVGSAFSLMTFLTSIILGLAMGREARPGEVYTLIGDLGVGKTVFTKGLAAGLGIKEPVSSPTFTILQEYEEGRLPFYHFDVYRIGDVEEMDEIGYEDYFYGDGVCLIEWADLIREILPEHYKEIRIEKDLDKGFDYRRISICEF